MLCQVVNGAGTEKIHLLVDLPPLRSSEVVVFGEKLHAVLGLQLLNDRTGSRWSQRVESDNSYESVEYASASVALQLGEQARARRSCGWRVDVLNLSPVFNAPLTRSRYLRFVLRGTSSSSFAGDELSYAGKPEFHLNA